MGKGSLAWMPAYKAVPEQSAIYLVPYRWAGPALAFMAIRVRMPGRKSLKCSWPLVGRDLH
jgi:hypothetical protein